MAEMTIQRIRPLYTPLPCRADVINRNIRIADARFLPRKTARVQARFAYPAVGLIVAGEGFFQVGRGPRTEVHPGTLISVYPGAVFDYGPATWWNEYYVGFCGSDATSLLSSGLISQTGRPGRVPQLAQAVAAFDEIIQTWRRAKPGDADRASLMGQKMLVDLLTGTFGASRERVEPVEAVLKDCTRRMREAIDFQALALRHDISYSLLRLRILQRTGMSPQKYVTKLRCEAACMLLATSSKSMKQIAMAIGIADSLTFSRTFRRAPLAFRRPSIAVSTMRTESNRAF